jgi:homoserine dehydrogenase
VAATDVHREGISQVTAGDVASARAMGAVVKLLAICERTVDENGDEGVSVRVHPAMVPLSHPLAGVRDAFNAVFIEAEAAGELMFYGRGAGGLPTASAVLGDVISAARNRVGGNRGPGESAYAQLPLRPMGQVITRYHISLDVADRPGVLAQVSQVIADHGVSIETVRQQRVPDQPTGVKADVPEPGTHRSSLVVVTHSARDAALAATVQALDKLDVVAAVVGVMRVEGED